MEINLGRFLIREWRRGDEVSLVRHANNPKVSRTLREIFPHPYTSDDATQWISFATTKNPTTDFAIIVDGEAVGGIGFMLLGDVARRSVEIGYWLAEAHWGKGIMTDALRAISEVSKIALAGSPPGDGDSSSKKDKRVPASTAGSAVFPRRRAGSRH